MDFSVITGAISKARSACIIVGLFENRHLSPAARELDKQSNGYLTELLKRGDFSAKAGETLLLHDVPGTVSQRLLLVGCGKEKGLDAARYHTIINKSSATIANLPIKDALYTLTELTVKDYDLTQKIKYSAIQLRYQAYRFDQLKSRDKREKPKLKRISFPAADKRTAKIVQQALSQGTAIANGMDLTRTLGDLPGNICTPTYLANQAKTLAKDYRSLKVTILGETEMKRLKMGAFLSVTRGSRQPAKLIIMHYQGAARGQQPVVLVGKGITFDSGGVSIKPSPAMDEMKYDMCGGASVFGTLRAIAELQLPINVVGIVPACENMPDGDANKPGDIVTSMSGQTIEVLNTDAEGRLVLCDALTYAARFKPDTIIDIATLTGACVVALGSHASGLLSNDEPLAKALLAAGNESHDRAWQMPLWDDYQSQLDTNFADMANIGGREAGTITAACFLSRFTKDYRWAHLDIAGTAWLGGAKKGATGRPVPLLVHYLMSHCK